MIRASQAAQQSTSAVAYAVFLGCTSPARLQLEWQITSRRAAHLLANAERRGLIRRIARARYICENPPGAYRQVLSVDLQQIAV